MIKMAAVVVWRSQHRRNLMRNRVFRDRKNPLDMYDDVELYDKFRFRRHDILTIVDELLDDLEYPDRHATRLLAGYSASYSGIVYVCEFVSRTWWLRRKTIRIDQSTASRTIHRVTNALFARMHEWVQLPTQQQADRQKASSSG